MITFNVRTIKGHDFQITEDQNTSLLSAIQKLFKKEKILNEIKCVLSQGGKIDEKKTLLENNITNGGSIIIVLGDETPTQIEEKNEDNPKEKFIKCLKFLITVCKVPIDLIDNRGNCIGGWQKGRKNGPPGYLKEYYPPLGWFGIGIKAWGLYDNGDNSWIGTNNSKGEWYIAYHGIKSLEALNGILLNGFRRGFYQSCKNDENINPLTKSQYPECGEGVYFIQNFSETQKYIKTFSFSGDYYKIVLMCRVNPYKVRIAEIGDNLESWIVNGDKLDDPNGRKRDDEVRIYRILMHLGK